MFVRLFKGCGLVLIVLFLCEKANSQDLHLQLFTGYASYNLTELKAHRASILGELPFEVKVVDDFPAYFTFGGKLRVTRAKIPFGVIYRVGSTGSRASYRDYSGSFLFEQTIKYQSFGIETGTSMELTRRFSLEAWLAALINFNDIDYRTDVRVGQEPVDRSAVLLQSIGGGIYPSLSAVYEYGVIKLYVDAGYEWQLDSKVTLRSDTKLRLYDNTNTSVEYSGSGFRASVGVAVRLMKAAL